jgi:hypothetical protein
MEDIMDFDEKDKEFEGIITQTFDQVLGEHIVDDDTPTIWPSLQIEKSTSLWG